MTVLQAIAQLWLGTLFLYTGAHKLLRPGETTQAIRRYRLLPPARAPLVAHLLTAGELVTALAVLYLSTTQLGGIGSAFLGGVFVIASSSAVARRIDTSCGCIGASDGPRVGLDTVGRASAILLVGIALAIVNRGSALPVGVAIAAGVCAILPAARSAMLARRDQRRREAELARNIETILRAMAKESQPVESAPTIPILVTEAIR